MTLPSHRNLPYLEQNNGLVLGGKDIPAVVALLPVLFAVIHFGVVQREEDYLECKFGDSYLEYRQSVPRWF